MKIVTRLGEAVVGRLRLVYDDTQPDYAVWQWPMARLKRQISKHVNGRCAARDPVKDQRVYGSR
jgi:hypothetical protein